MKQCIIIHGQPDKEEYLSDDYPSPSNNHWIPWLQKQLSIKDISTQTPEILEAYNPQYDIWKTAFENYPINEETIVVGHSTGAGFILRWLSENKGKTVGKVVLVAPWIDPEGELEEDFFKSSSFDTELVSRTSGTTIFLGEDDSKDVHDSTEFILENITGIKVLRFENRGHFIIQDMGTEEFPELLDIILK